MTEDSLKDYRLVVKNAKLVVKSYHTVEIVYGKAVVTLYMKGSCSEKMVNYYLLSHEDRIQKEIKDKIDKQYLPKLPKAPIVPNPVKKPVPANHLHAGSFVEKSFYCARCNMYSYKGYLLENGSYICRDCKNLARNPNPKPRLVFQPIEGGKKR